MGWNGAPAPVVRNNIAEINKGGVNLPARKKIAEIHAEIYTEAEMAPKHPEDKCKVTGTVRQTWTKDTLVPSRLEQEPKFTCRPKRSAPEPAETLLRAGRVATR